MTTTKQTTTKQTTTKQTKKTVPSKKASKKTTAPTTSTTEPAKPTTEPQPEPQDFSKDVPGVKRGLQKRAHAGERCGAAWPQDNVLSRAAAARFATTRIEYTWFGDAASSQGTRDVLAARVDVLLQLSKKTRPAPKVGSESTYILTVKGLYPGKYRHTLQARNLNDARTQAEHFVDAIIFRLADNMFVEFAKDTRHTLSELLHSAAVALQKTGVIKKRVQGAPVIV